MRYGFARRVFLAIAVLTLVCLGQASAAPLTLNNIVVLKVDATGQPANAAGSVDLLEFTGSGSLVQTIASTGLTQNVSATTEGFLDWSGTSNGFLTYGGYNASVGTTNVSSTLTTGASAVPRLVARVGLDGMVDLTTSTTSFSGTNINSATTDDGSRFWMGGNRGADGLQYTTYGASGIGTVINTTSLAARATDVVNGQLYFATSTNIWRTTTPTPDASSPSTKLLPIDLFFENIKDFVLLDRDNNGTLDTLYVATQSGGIRKYSSTDGISWTARGFTSVAGSQIYGLDGFVDGAGNAVLYATTGTGATQNNSLVTLTDTTAFNTTINNGSFGFTTLATAGSGMIFRGVAIVPEPGSMLLAAVSGLGFAGAGFWRMRKRRLGRKADAQIAA